MSDSLLTAAQKILDITNDGLDIIQDLYPQAETNKNFKLRPEEKTASASLKKIDNRWKLTDFGGTIRSEDCFGLYAIEKNIAYYEAILEIGRDLEQSRGIQIFEQTREFYKYEFREYNLDEFPHELNDKKFHFITKDFNDYELQLLGPFVTTEDCLKVNLYSLEEYSYYNEERKKVFRFIATDKFPIMAFINNDSKIGQWLKIYMPKGSKKWSDDGKDRRFRHVGGKPKGFVFGLDRIKTLYETGLEAAKKKYAEDKGLDIDEVKESQVNFKLDRIVLASGGSDGLNFLSLGETAIWFNSETSNDKADKFLINDLFRKAKEVVNVPDADVTGKREGKSLALEFLNVKTLWLDKYLKSKSHKDFKDYVNSYRRQTINSVRHEVKKMLSLAMPAQFWETSVNEKSNRVTYTFHHMYAFYFLRLNGFCRIDDSSRRDGYYFARVNGHIVEELKTTQSIKDYFRNFLLQKQDELGVKEIPHALLNMMITSQKITDGHLANMHNRTLDFSDFTQTSQTFFLGNRIFEVNRKGTEEKTDFNNYVLKSQLLENLISEETEFELKPQDIKEFTISNPFFNIRKIGDSLYDIDILDDSCDFLNYLVHTSRIHWEKERAAYIQAGYPEEEFYNRTKFKIKSDFLSAEDNEEQVQHLVNKIYAFGYLAHRFKDPTRSWVVYAVDNAVIEDDVAEGGTGKSLFFEALRYIMNRHDINGKDDIETDKFLFEGVTHHTDFILFDDVQRNFSLEKLYPVITSRLTVNEKFEAKVNLSYRNSPKIGVSSNYSVRDRRGSSNRRRLLIGVSDYYHSSNDERPMYDPVSDLGHSLYTDWQKDQWFKFYNFVFQSLEFYLKTPEKIEAPDSNILMRSYLSQMGKHFQEWADDFYPNNTDVLLIKDDVLEDARKSSIKYMGSMTSNAFKAKTRVWCKVNGFHFSDRINKSLPQYDNSGNPVLDQNLKQKFKTTEHIKISKLGEDEEETYFENENLNPGINDVV